MAVEEVLNSEIRAQFENEHADAERVRSLLAECQSMKVPLEREIIGYAAKGYFDRLSERLLKTPEDVELLRRLIDVAKLVRELPFESNLWKPQNIYFDVSRNTRPQWSERAGQGDPAAQLWSSLFAELGDALGFSILAQPQEHEPPPAGAEKRTEPALVAAG